MNIDVRLCIKVEYYILLHFITYYILMTRNKTDKESQVMLTLLLIVISMFRLKPVQLLELHYQPPTSL